MVVSSRARRCGHAVHARAPTNKQESTGAQARATQQSKPGPSLSLRHVSLPPPSFKPNRRYLPRTFHSLANHLTSLKGGPEAPWVPRPANRTRRWRPGDGTPGVGPAVLLACASLLPAARAPTSRPAHVSLERSRAPRAYARARLAWGVRRP